MHIHIWNVLEYKDRYMQRYVCTCKYNYVYTGSYVVYDIIIFEITLTYSHDK